MPEAELAERVGVSRSTIQRIESGDHKCEIGLVFEAAYIVGVDLFSDDSNIMSLYQKSINDSLMLLPKRIRKQRVKVENDF